MSIKFYCVVTAACMLALPAWAETAPVTLQVYGQAVVVVPPEGDCAYDRTNPVDAKMIDLLEKGNQDINQVGMAFADCKSIEATRAGAQNISVESGQILFPKKGVADVKDLSRSDFVKMVTEYFMTHASEFDAGVKKGYDRSEALLNDTTDMNGPPKSGVIRSDPDLVQVGMTQSVDVADKTVYVVGVITSTKLGVPASINMYRPANGSANGKVMHDLSDAAATYVHRLIALNPDNTPPHSEQQSYALGKIVGYAVVAGLGLFIFYKKRKQKS